MIVRESVPITDSPTEKMSPAEKKKALEIHRQKESLQVLRSRQALVQKKARPNPETEEKRRSNRLHKFFGEDFVDFTELQADPTNRVNSQFAEYVYLLLFLSLSLSLSLSTHITYVLI